MAPPLTDVRSLRADLRRLTVGADKKFRSKTVTLKLADGVEAEFEVRQPTIATRSAILKAAKANSGNADKIEIGELQVEAIMHCCFVPGTDTAVFEKADRDSLLNQPAGGFVEELATVALELLNVDAKAIEKNSEGTPSGS